MHAFFLQFVCVDDCGSNSSGHTGTLVGCECETEGSLAFCTAAFQAHVRVQVTANAHTKDHKRSHCCVADKQALTGIKEDEVQEGGLGGTHQVS